MEGRPLMRQNWRRLLFLHWAMEPGIVQASLPSGLWVETWDGAAWLAIVPFAMERVRPVAMPGLPGVSNFLELNVRTYVRDESGMSGVWFFSLDCSQPLAVWGARTLFRLPYFRARMSEEVGLSRTEYTCRRSGTNVAANYRYRAVGPAGRAEPGSLEEFLIERYRLFTAFPKRLRTARVAHEPYQIQPVEVLQWSMAPLVWNGIHLEMRPPDHAVYSPGVDVRVFGVK